ncbi:MAG: aminotransferase, partial [Rhodobacteraceae bacterium]|nr:aminotransferase [Paracoccaceae bacterium]
AEDRAPDSIQFNLTGMTDAQIAVFAETAGANGVKVQVFGASKDNARAFWNWEFLGPQPDLPQTRAMLMRACDVRLPARLTLAECDVVAGILTDAAAEVMGA